MRTDGLWHAELVELLVSLRHTDTLVIADAGLPVPDGVRTVDLGWRRREPRVLPVLDAVLTELVVERATLADEADHRFVADVRERLRGVAIERTAHETFKSRCADARAVVRTGEDTPYANVILHAGVPFRPTGERR
ncbi:MAG TPA: D-ribose pyranase [Streptosporangiales bacterium]